MTSLPLISGESLLYALVQVLPACLQTPLGTGLPPVSMPRLHPEAPPYTHTAWSPESLSP